jgi:DNA-binding transcriptional ArsR family regulator
VDIDQARDVRHFLLQLGGERLIASIVAALKLHVDLRRHAEIQHLRDEVGRLEVEEHVRKSPSQFEAQPFDDIAGRLVTFAEFDLDRAVVDPDLAAVGEGEIVEAKRQPNVIEDEFKILRIDGRADLVLDLLEDLFRPLDASASGCAHVQLDEARIDAREEIGAYMESQRDCARDDA